jgi:hypothetical protein
MSKHVLLILSVIFSFIYTLMVYYSMDRYLTLYFTSTEGYSKEYMKLDKADDKGNVSVIISASPRCCGRRLDVVLSSILDQTVKVDKILVDISECDFVRIPVLEGGVVEFLRDREKLVDIVRESDADTRFVFLQDDVIYGKDFLQNILEKSLEKPDKIVVGKYAVLVRRSMLEDSSFTADVETLSSSISKDMRENLSYTENYKRIF